MTKDLMKREKILGPHLQGGARHIPTQFDVTQSDGRH